MTARSQVLLVDDDLAVAQVLVAILGQGGIATRHVPSGEAALKALEERPFDLVVTDLRMPGIDGMALLELVGQKHPDTPVILLTAHGSVPLAVEAMRKGAADFVLKPFDREEILYVVKKVLAAASAPEALPETGWIGQSAKMGEVESLLRKAAAGNATVLIRGESGTGKELAARTLHALSPRREKPFVKVHCAALPETLLESELFGYEKGAFTGATTRKPGRVELAQGGTLFLDEIGDITPATQVKLLRLLQDREFEPLGTNRTLKADLRFVAATHQPLEQRVKEGTFREDLFYRLNVVPVWMPPLRERPDDVALLAEHFCRAAAKDQGREVSLAPEAIARLASERWPGNVRQLQNFIERLVVLAEGTTIPLAEVERELGRAAPAPELSQPTGSLDERRKNAERAALLEALTRARQNRTAAARLLGISRRTLYNKLEEHGLV